MVKARASQVALVVKNLSANARDIRDAGSIPRWGRSPEGGLGNPLQYSCLENPMDRGAGKLQSMGSQRAGHDWSNLAQHAHCESKGQSVGYSLFERFSSQTMEQDNVFLCKVSPNIRTKIDFWLSESCSNVTWTISGSSRIPLTKSLPTSPQQFSKPC